MRIGKVVVVFATTFLFLACSRGVEKTQPPDLYGSSPEGEHGGLHPDSTDLGGDIRQPDSPCPAPDSQVYRYTARTIGGNARIDDFCVGDGLEAFFVNQPPDSLLGDCPTDICGVATTSRRGPIEAALLQSVVSLEQSRVLKMKGMHQSTDESAHRLYQVDVHEGTVKFRLDRGVECVAKLELFEERVDTNRQSPGEGVTGPQEQDPTQDRIRYFYTEGPTVARGSLFMEQTVQGATHDLLVLLESHYEGRHESEVFKQETLCHGSNGPIAVADSPVYGFHVNRANTEEWMVFSFLKPWSKSSQAIE